MWVRKLLYRRHGQELSFCIEAAHTHADDAASATRAKEAEKKAAAESTKATAKGDF